VPTDDETHDALVAYLAQRSSECDGVLKADDPIFVSYSHRNSGDRLSYEGVYKLFKEIAQAAGLENLHPHRGRHTFSSRLLEEEVDAYLAMTLMRQKSLKAFNTYNNRIRQKAARAAFWKAKGVTPRKTASVEQMIQTWEQHQNKAVRDPEPQDRASGEYSRMNAIPSGKEVTVQLSLKVEDRMVTGRKKAKVKRAIESQVLARYGMVKPKKRGGAYELTIQFEREDDIAAITSEMLWEMNLLAELDDCLLWHEFAVGEG
jgi:hypothetical protein